MGARNCHFQHHPTAPAEPVKITRPAKPQPDSPLFAHAAGVWAKKIRGKLHSFGPWADPQAALDNYLAQKDDLHAGRTPRPDPDALPVKDLSNRFLNAKQALVDAGELAPLTWGDYKTACVEIVTAFGKGRLVSDLRPEDFAALRKRLAKTWGRTASARPFSPSAAPSTPISTEPRLSHAGHLMGRQM
jgi:hypothetical protein